MSIVIKYEFTNLCLSQYFIANLMIYDKMSYNYLNILMIHLYVALKLLGIFENCLIPTPLLLNLRSKSKKSSENIEKYREQV